MKVPFSKRLSIAKRRQQVAQLALEGHTQTAIAEMLSMTQAAISKDLTQIRIAWRESQIRDFDEVKSEELARLALIEREAWEAWRRSQQPAQTATVDGQAGSQKAKRTVRHQYGDPRFLQIALDASMARRQLLGLDAPTKIAPTTPDGQPLTNEQRHLMIECALNERFGPDIIDVTSEGSTDGLQPPTNETSPGEPDRPGTQET